MDEHNCTLAAQCADWLPYICYFLSLSNRKNIQFAWNFILFYSIICLFLDKPLIDYSIHYHFSNNLLVHTYLSTTDYADYHPTQDNVVTWNTNHSIYNVWMQNFHCITLIYSIWQRDKISKWETEYTKNICLTVQCVTWYVDICGTIGAIDNTACKIC